MLARRAQFMQAELDPQLGGLVDDDEQQLVVLARPRRLGGEEHVQAEVAAIGQIWPPMDAGLQGLCHEPVAVSLPEDQPKTGGSRVNAKSRAPWGAYDMSVRRCKITRLSLSQPTIPPTQLAKEFMARVTVEDCVQRVPNRFNLVLLAANRARAIAAGGTLTIDRDNDKNPVVALREIAEDMVDATALRETLIGSLQRVDEHSEAEEEAETLALLADPSHVAMSEQELVRALQSDRDGGQEERY